MNNFYIYIYLDPRKSGHYEYDNYCFLYEPFYIGKGKGKRFKKIYGGRNKYFKNTINKIKELSFKPIITKLKENLNEKDSFIFESELIKSIGRKDLNKGPLVNFTDGGEGVSGYKWTEKQLKKQRKNFQYIKNEFEKRGYILLTKENEYKNNKQKLDYIHKECGKKHSIKWNSLQYGQYCPTCSKKEKSKKMIGNKNCFYGKKHSDKTLKLLSELHSGNNNPMYGKHHSEESKRKNKESHLGKLLGEDNPRSKLTEDDVILIKMAFKELKDITQKEIAKLFNVHQTQVSKIKLGKIWSHIKLKGLYNE